jgi:asparagine synthase (glutamine-hydrolysing)
LPTVSIIFDEVTECDERPFIQSVLAQGEIVPHYAHGDKSGPLSDIETILKCEDEAYISPNHFYSWIANRAANEVGLRVVLDGFDGDSTVSHGITRLTELARQGQWRV